MREMAEGTARGSPAEAHIETLTTRAEEATLMRRTTTTETDRETRMRIGGQTRTGGEMSTMTAGIAGMMTMVMTDVKEETLRRGLRAEEERESRVETLVTSHSPRWPTRYLEATQKEETTLTG